MIRKKEIDHRIAALIGKNAYWVQLVTSLFLSLVSKELAVGEEVDLPFFGKLYVGKRARVRLKKSPRLRRMIGRKRMAHSEQKGAPVPMEKYGVDESKTQQDLEKRAASGCPDCGQKPIRHGNVLVCPKCGTSPFEADDKNK